MALNDWTKSATAGGEVTLYASNPPEGSAHLYIQCPTGYVFFYPSAPAYSKGVSAGRYRTLLRLDNSTANSVDVAAGFIVMGSALTIGTVSGNFYRIAQIGGTIQLRRGNGTTIGAGGTLLTEFTHAVATGTAFSLQVDWSVEASAVEFSIATGGNSDFSDLAPVLTYSDTSGSRLTSSVIEGLAVSRTGTGGPALVSYDLTSLGLPS